MAKSVLIAGATGLVGKDLLDLFINDRHFDKIKVLTRRHTGVHHDKIEEIVVHDFDKLDDVKEHFNVNHVVCCLGTTKKKAGSKEMFRKIDLEYPIKMAELSKDQPDFIAYHVVTSVGAKAGSALFYNSVKGELEDALKAMDLGELKIYQPSLLLGKRGEFRIGEEIAKAISAFLSFFVIGNRGRLWSIHSLDVAKAIIEISKREQPGTETFRPRDMLKLAHYQPI